MKKHLKGTSNMAKLVKGIIAAMVTSMYDDESLNIEEIKTR